MLRKDIVVLLKRILENTCRAFRSGAGLFVVVFAGLFAISTPAIAKDEKIILSVALFDGCPFICPDESGPFVDGLKSAFAGSQYDLQFKRLPFARAVKGIQSGHIDLLPGLLKDSVGGVIFPDSWLYFTRLCFFSRADDAWRWNGLNSLKDRTIAVEKGIIHTQEFFDHLQTSESIMQLTGDDLLRRQLQMLALGRIQSFTAEQTVLAHHLEQNDIASDSVQNSGCFDPEFEYVAIYAKHPNAQDIRAVLTSGLAEYKKTIAPDLR